MASEGTKRRITRTKETEVEEIPIDEDVIGQGGAIRNRLGYEPDDLVRAPGRPPEPYTHDTADDTSNRKVVLIYAAAAVLGILGIALMLADLLFISVILFLVAGATIVAVVFAPIR